MIPHVAPKRNELAACSAMRKEIPTPKIVTHSEEKTIVVVDGKATRLMRL